MYDRIYLNVQEVCGNLGLGRNTVLRLCKDRPHSFPAVKVGNRYQVDLEKLNEWRNRWVSGEFEIEFGGKP